MKITLSKDVVCGNVEVPGGEYMVALLSDTQQLQLTGAGRQYKIPAVKRRSTAKTKVTSVVLYPAGGAQLSLIMSTPKLGEWIAMMEVAQNRKK